MRKTSNVQLSMHVLSEHVGWCVNRAVHRRINRLLQAFVAYKRAAYKAKRSGNVGGQAEVLW